MSLARLDEPVTALAALEGLVVIDEVQLRPDLFPVLCVLADRHDFNGRFFYTEQRLGAIVAAILRVAGRAQRNLNSARL